MDNFTNKPKIDLIHKTNLPERHQTHRGEGREAVPAQNIRGLGVPSPGGGAERSRLRPRCPARTGGQPGSLSLVLEKLLEKPQPEARRHKEKEKVAEEQAETAKGESGSRP